MVVSQLRSQYGDRARHHLVSHHNIGPDRVQELPARNHVPLPPCKLDEHIHHLWFKDALSVRPFQEVFLRVVGRAGALRRAAGALGERSDIDREGHNQIV